MAPGPPPPIAIPPTSPVGMEMGTGPREGASAAPLLVPLHWHTGGVPSLEGQRGTAGGREQPQGGLGSASPPPLIPCQAMDPSGTPSVPLMIGCAVSCMALLTLLVIYAAFWR